MGSFPETLPVSLKLVIIQIEVHVDVILGEGRRAVTQKRVMIQIVREF